MPRVDPIRLTVVAAIGWDSCGFVLCVVFWHLHVVIPPSRPRQPKAPTTEGPERGEVPVPMPVSYRVDRGRI